MDRKLHPLSGPSPGECPRIHQWPSLLRWSLISNALQHKPVMAACRKEMEALKLHPGQKMQIVEFAGRIELIPERDIKELRGFLKGINTDFKREEDRV